MGVRGAELGAVTGCSDGRQVVIPLVADYSLGHFAPAEDVLGYGADTAGEEVLRIVAETKSHFFATPEAAWEWHESSGLASGGAAERAVPLPRDKRSRARRIRRRGEIRSGPVACAPDLEQLIQERREAIHSAAAISASLLASESDTELSQPLSGKPVMPDCLSELGLVGGPPVTPATADELF
ncbi:hypothetical protein NDU88_007778 [Pleurodeles waltl]|uniref:Uncharacterized protein n=1 Tax=Pleurodeles waltl TaxID=8319 RepID=A0AAV7N4F2_PLEWA|nr:hypothetical protein NDU88_007778 [Pleurodeles waltl]